MYSMLSRRWLVNGLLFLVIGIAFMMGYRDRAESPDRVTNPVTSLKVADVNRVSIQLPDNNHIRLGKTAGQWFIESPLQWPAHNTTLDRIIGIASSEFDSSIEAGDIDLSALGLGDSKVILTLNDTRISFGTINNIGARRYLMVGSTIFLLADVHLPFILQGLPGLIDRRLLPPSIPIHSFNLGTTKLARDEMDNWQSSSVIEIPLAQINQFVHHWQTLEAPALKTFQPAVPPLRKVIVGLEDGSEIEFLLISIFPELVIARPELDIQYHFNEKQHPKLFDFIN